MSAHLVVIVVVTDSYESVVVEVVCVHRVHCRVGFVTADVHNRMTGILNLGFGVSVQLLDLWVFVLEIVHPRWQFQMHFHCPVFLTLPVVLLVVPYVPLVVVLLGRR